MNRMDGSLVTSELAHLRQSVADILTTPIGSRVMRRDYGSRLPELLDAPLNRAGMLDVIAATAEALARWEPRLRLKRVRVTPDTTGAGRVALALEGVFTPGGQPLVLDGVVL